MNCALRNGDPTTSTGAAGTCPKGSKHEYGTHIDPRLVGFKAQVRMIHLYRAFMGVPGDPFDVPFRSLFG